MQNILNFKKNWVSSLEINKENSMKKIAMALLVLSFSVVSGAQSGSSEGNVTIHDLNKALEICKSLDHKNKNIDCSKAAQECAGSQDKRACLEQKAK